MLCNNEQSSNTNIIKALQLWADVQQKAGGQAAECDPAPALHTE